MSGKNAEGIFDAPFSKFGDISTIQEYADEVEAETNEYLKTQVELNHLVENKGFRIMEIPIHYSSRLGEKKLKIRHGLTILKRILIEST